MRKTGLAIAGTVLTAAIGLAAWQRASAETWAGVMLLMTSGVLVLSSVGALCGGYDERPRFVGFAVFGWGYFALARWYSYHQGPMPTACWVPGSGDIHNDLLALPPVVWIAHDAWALACGILGSILAGCLVTRSSAREHGHAGGTSASTGPSAWWQGPAFAGLLGIGAVAAAMLAGWRQDAESAAGAVFLLTWALAGLAIVGAICTRGRPRKAWIGAASFGTGYLILAFSSVATMTLPTDHFLNAILRPGGPMTAGEKPDDDPAIADENQRIRRALREPITLHFPKYTSMNIVLDHIKNSIRGPLGKHLVMYAGWDDWVYLSKELNRAVVTIDRADIPADDALRLCLGQIGLTYRVQSGYVRIVVDAYQPVPFKEDPVMIAGHSLLALVAAVFGGVGALYVSRLGCREAAERVGNGQ